MMDNLPAIAKSKAIRRWDRAKAPKYLRPDEIKAILTFEYNKRRKDEKLSRNLNKYYVLFSLLWNTGARISEALSLIADDVKPDHQVYFRTLKRRMDASRYIPISDSMYSDLTRYMNESAMKGSDRLFDLSKVAVHKELKNVCRQVGLPSWIHVHTFRHSFAVNCLSNNVHINTLKEILGHGSVENTMIYLKVFQPEIRDQLSKVPF